MLDKLKCSPQWRELFKHCANPISCNVPNGCDERIAARLRSVPLDAITLEAVVEIIAIYDGSHNNNDFCGVFQLADGRYIAIRGWFYNLGNEHTVLVDGESVIAKTIPDILQFGLTADERARFTAASRMGF